MERNSDPRTPSRLIFLKHGAYTGAASNAIWIQLVLLAIDLTTWAQQLALAGTWRVAQPKTLRLKLSATADDWNHGDRHLGPRDEQPRPHWLTPGKSKTR